MYLSKWYCNIIQLVGAWHFRNRLSEKPNLTTPRWQRTFVTLLQMRTFIIALLLALASGLKLNVALSRRSALTALVFSPTAAIAANNAGTYGYVGGYQALPGTAPPPPPPPAPSPPPPAETKSS